MEQLPPRSPDEEPHGHEAERLDPGEIDLTGVVRQDDALADVIHDAISEAEGDAGELPEWGARTMARALANERADPFDGALHQFAITGHADPEQMAQELANLHEHTDDTEIREWVNWLGTYVIRMPDQEGQPVSAEPRQLPVPDPITAPKSFGARLRHAFAEADIRGEAIRAEEAQALAALLALFLDPGSAIASFADTGDANPIRISQECQEVRRRAEHVPGASDWIDRFEQHLAARSDLGRNAPRPGIAESAAQIEPRQGKTTNEPDTGPDNAQVAAGLQQHGAAFEAFLSLSDINPSQADLLESFGNSYIGAYDSMDALIADLTEGIFSEAELAQWAAEGITREDLVRAAWDIIELNGKLYVFSQ
jgi:hypothetical protein